jgi:small multidrug resistance family-3 protein
MRGSGVSQDNAPYFFPEVGETMNILDKLVQDPRGALAVLALAAFLEAWGDSFFQVGFYRSSGMGRVLALGSGAAVLAAYGSLVNVPRWDFGKLLGAYVVLFFLMAQLLNKVRFGQSPTPSIYAGGALIVAGGLVIAFWKQ